MYTNILWKYFFEIPKDSRAVVIFPKAPKMAQNQKMAPERPKGQMGPTFLAQWHVVAMEIHPKDKIQNQIPTQKTRLVVDFNPT